MQSSVSVEPSVERAAIEHALDGQHVVDLVGHADHVSEQLDLEQRPHGRAVDSKEAAVAPRALKQFLAS
jgi:hypothetical protein